MQASLWVHFIVFNWCCSIWHSFKTHTFARKRQKLEHTILNQPYHSGEYRIS